MPLGVLLVEDDDLMRSLVRTYLASSENYRLVGEARDGVEATEAARRLQPDVILLDVVMHRLNGLDALPAIRAAAPRTRVVMMSMLDAWRVEISALDLGAVGFIDKALDGPEMIGRLDNLLGLRHAPRVRTPASPTPARH